MKRVNAEFPELEHFSAAIAQVGYGQSKMLFRIKWDESVNYELLREIIEYNRTEKRDCKTFWRA